MKTVRLDSTGHMTGPIHTLLTTNEGSWEGYTIENPSMIHWHGHWYLFYSANSFLADRAGHSPVRHRLRGLLRAGRTVPPRQRGPVDGEHRARIRPGRRERVQGPERQAPLAYGSYRPGEYRPNTGIPQPRRMHIVTVVRHPNGTLSVKGRP